MNKKGFTLVELLIVIAVLGILAAIAVPNMSGITDTFKYKSDVQSAEAIANQVEVKLMAGELDPSSDITIYADGTDDASGGGTQIFGETLPVPQADSSNSNAFIVTITSTTPTDDFYEDSSEADGPYVLVQYTSDVAGVPTIGSNDGDTSNAGSNLFATTVKGVIE